MLKCVRHLLKCKVSSRETSKRIFSVQMYNSQINAKSVLMYDGAETLYEFQDVEFKLLDSEPNLGSVSIIARILSTREANSV